KTCNNEKNLSEVQLEHEKEDEFVVVVDGGEGDCKYTPRGRGEKLEWWFEQDIDKEEERFERDKDGDGIPYENRSNKFVQHSTVLLLCIRFTIEEEAKTCNNEKILSEVQLEHEKEDEFVVVVDGGEGDCKYTLRGRGEKLEWWFEQDIDKEEERFKRDKDGGEL
nr:hypothetical protein [Tanacetum cinerariifolium]